MVVYRKIGNITKIIPGIQSQYFYTTIRKARHRVQEESAEIDGLGRPSREHPFDGRHFVVCRGSVREHTKSGIGSVGSTAFFLLCEDVERR